MTQADFREVGFRWTKPTWERTGDASWVLIVPSSMLKHPETARKSRSHEGPSQRMYEIYEMDGNWFDQLHERQVERLLQHPAWRDELRPSRKAV
ncbi:MAG: hypothetical protein Q8K78_16995 [Planctomycetaceae bacterium]|nr:hypothetical protein [Planctomycetaceae bacterium]